MEDQTQDELDFDPVVDEAIKTERFMRVAKVRFNNAMKAMELLQNCANPQSYEPNPAVVDMMMEQLQDRVAELEAAFRPQTLQEQNPFELDL